MPVSDLTKYHGTKVPGIYFRFKANGTKTHYVRFVDETGKRRWSACGTFVQAKVRLAELTTAAHTGEVVASPTMTLGGLLPLWSENREALGIKPRTLETERRSVRLYIEKKWGNVKLRDITASGISTWVNSLKKQDGGEMNSGTKGLALAHLSSILSFAVESKALATNPIKQMSSRSRPKPGDKVERNLRAGELDAICFASGKREVWLGPILRLLYATGLRLGEVVGLQWQDIDFDAKQITVERQAGRSTGTTKSGKVRKVPMMRDAYDVLTAQRALVREQRMALGLGAITPTTPVFPNSGGGVRGDRDVQRAFDEAREKSKVSSEPRKLTLHDIRHSVASELANNPKVPITSVQAILGHADLKTTQGYIHDALAHADDWAQDALATA